MVAILLLAVAGCGYSAGVSNAGAGESSSEGYQWKSLYRPGINTIAISVFTSREFRRYDEIRFTHAVAKQIEAYTPYKLASRDVADSVLEGQIRFIRQPVLSSSANGGVPNEQLYEMGVDFTWKDLRTGKIIASRTVFDQTTAYYPTLGESSFVGAQTAAERLALAVVQQLEADW
ncbi:MAG TPA: hypothetical protein VGN72_05160 [Tepidisphaeraceae bacterium]|nr:hypothetical protein [Tepidisphaeraceae bacterium]